MERQETIKNEDLKKLLLKKEELTGKKNKMIEEHNLFREDFTKRLQAVKDKLVKNQEHAVKVSKDIKVVVGEFEEVKSAEVVGDDVVLNVVDKIEEFKEQYLEFKKGLVEKKEELKK